MTQKHLYTKEHQRQQVKENKDQLYVFIIDQIESLIKISFCKTLPHLAPFFGTNVYQYCRERRIYALDHQVESICW